MKFSTITRAILACVCLLALGFSGAHAQSEAGRLSFGFNVGGIKYWGDFTDNQFWLGGDLFVRYNILGPLSLHGSVGLHQIRYKVNDDVIMRFPGYFGAGSQIGDRYPGTNIEIEEKNAIRVLTYETFLSLNLFPSQSFVPYVFGGIGYTDWNAANFTKNQALPNNSSAVYEKSKVMIPVGMGFEYYINENVVVNARGTFRFTGTDYLDDLEGGDRDDMFATFGAGFSYYILGTADSDGDGLSNSEERRIGTDPYNPDTDGDGLTDYQEVREYATDPLKADTDGDNLTDYAEIMQHKTSPVKADTDSDGLMDGEELARNTNPNQADTDNDELLDGDEVKVYKTDPTKRDTDEDGLTDGEEARKYTTNPLATDTDNDGLTDGAEVLTYKTNPTLADTDKDGLNDGDEVNRYKTDPTNADSDNDKLTDGEEIVRYKTQPMKADTDNDKLIDGDEVSARYNTDPLNPDTDKDGVIDGEDACPLIAGVRNTQDPAKNGCPAPPKVGTIVDFPDIYFVVNTDNFNYEFPQTEENLRKLLAYVQQCAGLKVFIEGHASAEGDPKRNVELSNMRAARIKNWLVESGVNPAKIAGTEGYGSSRPKSQEPTGKELKKIKPEQLEAIRKVNRRISVRVVATCD